MTAELLTNPMGRVTVGNWVDLKKTKNCDVSCKKNVIYKRIFKANFNLLYLLTYYILGE